jgi:hypothetical protein
MSGPTPGPWVVGYGSGLTGPTTPSVTGPTCAGRDWGHVPVSSGKDTVAIVPACVVRRPDGDQQDEDQMNANARLIAAAPDLLEALEKIGKCDKSINGHLARAAIAKAKGEDA